MGRFLLSFWWWFKTTYGLLYGIEVDSTCIGSIGLYNETLTESAEMRLVIFNSWIRQCRDGTMVFALFAQDPDDIVSQKKYLSRSKQIIMLPFLLEKGRI
ncbi:MAG TPA: hypothetical protein DCP92_21095 [Nitrospiraceae bacterium]|jgi:hypothetical protein|nr:hypothetical protein [Nitrospiraceae bacterium]